MQNYIVVIIDFTVRRNLNVKNAHGADKQRIWRTPQTVQTNVEMKDRERETEGREFG